MVDWVIEVLALYRASSRTVFVAVKLLDIYLARAERSDSLQVLCITCIYLASKYEDLKPLTLETVCVALGHGQISKAQVLSAERAVLRAVGYSLYFPTVYDWLELFLLHEDKKTQWLAWLLADIALLSSRLSGQASKALAEVRVFQAKRKLNKPTDPLRFCLAGIHDAFMQQYEAYKTEKTQLPAICTKHQIA